MIYHECDFCGHYKLLNAENNDKKAESSIVIDYYDKTLTVNTEFTYWHDNHPSYNRIDPPEPEIVEESFEFKINYCPMCGEKLGEC
jgi:hypothetical protein